MKQGSLFSKEPSFKFKKIVREHAEVYSSPVLLRQKIENHLEKVLQETRRNEFINVNLAMKIKDVCLILIDELTKESLEKQNYITATINYFITTSDEEEDLYSPLGFDDDAEIVNECLKLIGREDLLIEL